VTPKEWAAEWRRRFIDEDDDDPRDRVELIVREAVAEATRDLAARCAELEKDKERLDLLYRYCMGDFVVIFVPQK
jgi:hypothetical protein